MIHGACVRRNPHARSMTNYIGLTENSKVIRTMIALLKRRRFNGPAERRLRILLSRFYRANALLRLRHANHSGFRKDLVQALRQNPLSARSWALSPLAFLTPRLIRAALPAPAQARSGPRMD